jgi:hypothetical protein
MFTIASCDYRNKWVQPEQIESSTPKQWVELIRLKGNGYKKSDSYTYSGGKARIRYDFKAKTQDSPMVIYVVPNGTDIGYSEVNISGSETGESYISYLRKGDYYLNILSNGKWDIVVEELK